MHALGSVSLCAALRLDLISIQGPRVITPRCSTSELSSQAPVSPGCHASDWCRRHPLGSLSLQPSRLRTASNWAANFRAMSVSPWAFSCTFVSGRRSHSPVGLSSPRCGSYASSDGARPVGLDLYQAVLQRTGARPIIINPFDCATSEHAGPRSQPPPRAPCSTNQSQDEAEARRYTSPPCTAGAPPRSHRRTR